MKAVSKRLIAITLSLALASLLAGCSSGSKSDIARDPNGFLGYSDSFWDWYGENN